MIDTLSHFVVDIKIPEITGYNSAMEKGGMGDGGGICDRLGPLRR